MVKRMVNDDTFQRLGESMVPSPEVRRQLLRKVTADLAAGEGDLGWSAAPKHSNTQRKKLWLLASALVAVMVVAVSLLAATEVPALNQDTTHHSWVGSSVEVGPR
ncbi:MAG: hypothetical protein LBC29_07500 [Propionibacteriaceae bacterium]|jgi:hypothetical protein|nr:hypothetical protein [Propionibacteriaceae bacterium]